MNAATERTLKIVAPITVGVLLLALWYLLVDVAAVLPRSVPSPGAILDQYVEHGDIVLAATWVTARNALVGLVIGAVLGIIAAGIASSLRALDWMAAPVVAAIAVVPIVALTPILNTMFGIGAQTGRQIVAAIAAFIPVYINVLRGLRQTKAVQRDLFRASAANGGQEFRKLTLPTALPHLMTGLRIASSVAVISALVAEYFGGPKDGLGSAIASYASTRPALAWANVGAAIAVGLIFFLVTLLIERIATRRIK